MTSRTEEEKVHKYIFLWRRKTRIIPGEKENTFFVVVKKNIGEKEGKYLEMDILFHAEEKNIEERKVRKYLEKENIIFGSVGGASQGVGEGGPSI